MCTNKICFFSYSLSSVKVRTIQFEQKGIPFLNTYDGRTLVMTPLRSTWRRTRLLSSSSLLSAMLSWWLEVQTEGVLVWLKTVWSIIEALKLSTSETQQDMSLQQGWGIHARQRVKAVGVFARLRVLSLPSLKKPRRGSLANMLLKFAYQFWNLCFFFKSISRVKNGSMENLYIERLCICLLLNFDFYFIFIKSLRVSIIYAI